MKSSFLAASSLAALAVVVATPSFAQQSPQRTAGDGLRMPYQSGFWGHAGFNIGRSRIRGDCPAGFNCDNNDTAWKAYAGGSFNNTFGGEIGWLDLGEFARGGGTTKARGLDLAATAGVPLGQNSSVFLKAGAAIMRTSVSGPGVVNGKETDWGPRIGLGARIGLTPQWALRADLDRYRLEFPGGGKNNIDTFTVGAQYSFR